MPNYIHTVVRMTKNTLQSTLQVQFSKISAAEKRKRTHKLVPSLKLEHVFHCPKTI